MNATDLKSASLPSWGPLPPRCLLISILLQVPLTVRFWPLRPAPIAVCLGVALLAAAMVLNIWADRLFHSYGAGVRPFSPVAGLVSQGPFRFTRNPMYLGMVLASASLPLITSLYANFWAPAALAVWLHFRFVLPEEAFLRDLLGAPYLLYANTIPRWLGLPGPRPSPSGTRAAD